MDIRKLAAVAAGLLVVAAGAAGVITVRYPNLLEFDATTAGGDIQKAAGAAAAKPTPAAESKAASGKDEAAASEQPYEPTSRYIDEGLDPEVTTFAMGNGDQPTPEGAREMLSDAEIQRIINEHQNELLECYAASLQDDPELKGRVFFRFGIAPDGHVALVEVTESRLRSKSTEDCFVERARRWSFPPTSRSVLTKFTTDFMFAAE